MAAAAQTVRFMLQKHLKATKLSTAGATFARFIYSAPLVLVIALSYAGVTEQVLHEESGIRTSILSLDDGIVFRLPTQGGCEGFLVDGTAELEGRSIGEHDWFCLPADVQQDMRSGGCRLYLKQGGVTRLRSLS